MLSILVLAENSSLWHLHQHTLPLSNLFTPMSQVTFLHFPKSCFPTMQQVFGNLQFRHKKAFSSNLECTFPKSYGSPTTTFAITKRGWFPHPVNTPPQSGWRLTFHTSPQMSGNLLNSMQLSSFSRELSAPPAEEGCSFPKLFHQFSRQNLR